jgi:thioredoxin reductase (NADPH)
LFQVFQLGLQGIKAHVIDALPHAGGQCAELYGDKPIYDIPGIPVCTGQELVERLLAQIKPFAPDWHLGQQVSQLAAQPDGRWLLATTQRTHLLARSVFIAAGVGAFVPRTLKVEGISAFEGSQVHYHHSGPTAGQHVVVHGGDEPAVARAITLATALQQLQPDAPASVTLLHRRDVFDAPADLLAQLQSLKASAALHIVAGQITHLHAAPGPLGPPQLTALQLALPDGSTHTLPLDTLEAYLGISPRLGPVAEWGLAMDKKQLQVDPATFATSAPGIYAVGDINTYPGKRKLILCAFHEATLAAYSAAEAISGQKITVQYTTTSPRLQQLLGVLPAATPSPASP